jgi:hypothetical protein
MGDLMGIQYSSQSTHCRTSEMSKVSLNSLGIYQESEGKHKSKWCASQKGGCQAASQNLLGARAPFKTKRSARLLNG